VDDAAPDLLKFALRYRRTSLIEKTLLKDSAARRKGFSAALQQFEEQMEAAKVVTSATRPINLYYGLVQAGLAITAAHTSGNWTFGKHGLKVLDMRASLPEITIRDDGDGAFQYVAKATGSELITDTVTLGSLWKSLPDLCNLELDGATSPPALGLIKRDRAEGLGHPQLGPGHFRGMLLVNSDLPEQADRENWFRTTTAAYPGLSNAKLWGDVDTAFEDIRPGRFGVEIGWPVPLGPEAENVTEDEVNTFFDRAAAQYRFNEDRYIRPALLATQNAPSPLMTWWTLLYTFSMISRYQPVKWAEILDLDKSRSAAVVQYALQNAQHILPQLVLEALDNRPMLLAQTMRL
jgi:YaaC-like protein